LVTNYDYPLVISHSHEKKKVRFVRWFTWFTILNNGDLNNGDAP
jgi:hypothetical protein